MADSNGDLGGKICIVTGASSGIGLETARALAAMNATVVLACRSRARGEAALVNIQSNHAGSKAELMLLDLASQQSIRDFADAFTRRYDRLDVLVNNAATAPAQREVTQDGLEMQFGVNHLGPFLLTVLLLDLLKSSAPSRIVNVSSTIHKNARMNFDDLQSERGYTLFGAYGRSKLANVLFTYELARRLEGEDVTANCLHPGGVNTNLLSDMRGPLGWVVKLGMNLMLSPESGARTSVYLASSPEVAGLSGKYFIRRREAKSSARSHNVDDAKRLWEVSVGLTGLSVEG